MKNLKKYLGKLYLAIGWSAIIFILLSLPGSMIPKEQSFMLPGFDKIVHIGLFGGFVLLWCFYYSSKRLSSKKQLRIFFYIFLIASLYGIGMEYVQKYLIPMRDFDVEDILADLMGAGLAYGICNISLVE
ncbi:MAG TPA: VanZ family protein [Puia sp.]|nr:VanZ family protein [Puia sp.]